MLKIADIVRLKSGGPNMFISCIKTNSRGQKVACCEFGYPQNGSGMFPLVCLTKLGNIPTQFFIEGGAGKLGPR